MTTEHIEELNDQQLIRREKMTALAEQGIGASLQHYNPLIDDDIKKEFDLPAEWTLRAQMPFGSIEAPAGDKEFLDEAEQFKLID